jgi:sec-independent protein translocase protein TatA
MGELFTPTHLIVLAVVAVVLFGGKKLPELGKGLGEGLRGFKEGMKGIADDPATPAKPADSANTVTPQPGDDIKPPTA